MTWKLKTYVRWSTDNEIWLKNNLLFRSTTDWWTFDWWLHGVMTDKREKPTQLQYTCICFTLRALRSAVECVKIEGKNLEAIKWLNKCVTDSFMPCTVYNLSWGETKSIWGLTESVNKWQHYLRILFVVFEIILIKFLAVFEVVGYFFLLFMHYSYRALLSHSLKSDDNFLFLKNATHCTGTTQFYNISLCICHASLYESLNSVKRFSH